MMARLVAPSSLSMNCELNRTFSFGQPEWRSKLCPLKLARIGFYFDGPKRSVTCSSCSFTLSLREDLDHLENKHKRQSPQCEMCRRMHGVSHDEVLHKAIKVAKAFDGDQVDGLLSKGRNSIRNIALIFRKAYERATKSGAVKSTVDIPAATSLGFEADSLPAASSDTASVLPANTSSTINKIIRINRNQPDYPLLRSDKARLSTYFDWPENAHADPIALAAAGLFYTGCSDRVGCAYCYGYIRDWEIGDVPISEHKKHFPNCPFVLGNVPAEPVDSLAEFSAAQPLCDSTITRSSSLARSNGPKPKNPEFEEHYARVRSFMGKQSLMRQDIKALADAGYYYVGPEDNVKCFFCDGGLRSWKPEDDPWTEHAKYFPRCGYLKSCKDDIFIKTVQEINPPNLIERGIIPRTGNVNGHKSGASIMTDSSSPARQFKFEPREIKARMDSPIVRAVLNIGYSRDVVQRTIEKNLSETGDDFRSAESLVEAVIAFQEQQNTERPESRAAATAVTTAASHSAPQFVSTAAVLPPVADAACPSAPVTSSVAKAKSPVDANTMPEVQSGSVTAAPTNKTTKSNKKKKKKKQKKEKEPAATNVEATSDDNDKEVKQSTAVSGDRDTPPDELSSASFDPESRQLLEENRQLKEAKMCKVCLDEDSNTVFLPCGHLACCNTCSPALKNCPICRALIRGTVRIFVS